MEAYESFAFESEVYASLREAEMETELAEQRYTPGEVLAAPLTEIRSSRKAD